MFDIDMRYMAASPRWCIAHGLDRAALMGRNCYEVNPQLSEQWRDTHVRCLAGATKFGERQIRIPADGSLLWVRWEARPWRTETSEIGGVVVWFENITAEKEAQLAVAAREQQLQTTLDASEAGTWLTDPRTRRLVLDERTQAMCGMGPDAGGTTLDDVWRLVAPEDRDRVQRFAEQLGASADGQSWADEFRLVRPDGATRWMHCRGRTHRDDSGSLVRIAGILLDVTERRMADESVRRSEQQARLALEAASAFTGQWNLEGGPWIVEPHVAARIGVPPGQPFDAAAYVARVHPDDRAQIATLVAAAIADGGLPGWDVEYRLSFPDGSEAWFHSRGAVERDATGRARRLVGIMIDVTSRRRAEQELVRSHAALRLHAAELERRTAQLQRVASALMLAEQRTRERLAKVLHDHLQQLQFSALLHVQRAAAANPDLAMLRQAQRDLTDAIEETRTLSVESVPSTLRRGDLPGALRWLGDWMPEKYGLTVNLSIDERANPSTDDVRFLVFECVRELLFNVVKHARVDHATVALELDDADQIRLTVADAGVGFDVETLSRRPGVDGGVGLFGMRERLALFEGRLHVETAPGRGARFTMLIGRGKTGTTVPVDTPLNTEPEPQAGALPEDPRPLRILLADDHPTVRDALRHVLDAQPSLLVVGEASDGIAAVKLARTLAPDAILMDVSMPHMDGIEATRRIRACVPTARIFGLSTEEESRTPHAIEQAGADGYFFKGAGLTRLVERLLQVHAEIVRG